jgi:long-chain acyl-CoA synthetase
MIVSSGYSIYPSQIENVLDAHPAVSMSTVIGVPDPYKIEKVKAFLVLKPGMEPTDDVKESIYEHCKENIAKYAMPYEFEYRDSLPQTLVGKVAYTVLEQEELEKIGEVEAVGSPA